MPHVILLFQVAACAAIRPPSEVGVEGNVGNALLWLKRAIETVGAP